MGRRKAELINRSFVAMSTIGSTQRIGETYVPKKLNNKWVLFDKIYVNSVNRSICTETPGGRNLIIRLQWASLNENEYYVPT